MATEIVNVASGELVPTAHNPNLFTIEGSMPLPLEDLRTPMLRIVQGTTRNLDQAEKHIGEWRYDGDNSFTNQFEVVFYGLTNKSRVMFEANVFDKPPLCVSDDADWPRSQDQARSVQAGPSCAQCPFSKFGPNGEPPKCSETWNFLGWKYGTDMPFLYRAQGNAISPSRNFVRPFYFQKKPLFTALVSLTTKRTENAKGVFYIPVFQYQPLPPDDLPTYMEMAQALAGWRAAGDVDVDYEARASAPTATADDWAGHHRQLTPDEIMAMPEAELPAEPTEAPAAAAQGPELFPDDDPAFSGMKRPQGGAYGPSVPRGRQRQGAH